MSSGAHVQWCGTHKKGSDSNIRRAYGLVSVVGSTTYRTSARAHVVLLVQRTTSLCNSCYWYFRLLLQLLLLVVVVRRDQGYPRLVDYR